MIRKAIVAMVTIAFIVAPMVGVASAQCLELLGVRQCI